MFRQQRLPPLLRAAELTGENVRRPGRLHRSEEHTSELQSPCNLVCRLLLEKKKKQPPKRHSTFWIIILLRWLTRRPTYVLSFSATSHRTKCTARKCTLPLPLPYSGSTKSSV